MEPSNVNPGSAGAWLIVAGALGLGLIALGSGTSCRPNPDCYSSAECGEEQMCAAGVCVAADAGVQGVLRPTWHEVIFPIVQQKCWGGGNCHVRQGGTGMPPPGIPMALELYADTQQPSRQGNLVFQEMANRVQDLQQPMPPRGQSPLEAIQISFFRTWAQDNAPLGDPNLAPDAGVNTGGFDAGVMNTGIISTVPGATEIASGYFSLSGPAWGNANNVLLVTDRAQDTIFIGSETQPFDILLRPSNEAVGLGADANGALIMTQYLSREVSRVEGTLVTTLSDQYQGQRYNSPHDIVGRAVGDIYFTDPDFGLGVRPRELVFNGLFRLPVGGGAPIAEYQGPPSSGPSGLELSPDESRLYMADRAMDLILAFDVNPDGSLTQGGLFAMTFSSPDGITVDSTGNVYVATELGVQVFSNFGVQLGLLPTPSAATGVTFGGPALTTLYATTADAIYSFPMPISGVFR